MGLENPVRQVVSRPVDISAPITLVWAILTDLSHYRLWNPLNRRIESSLNLGDPVHLWVDDPSITGRVARCTHRLVAFDPPRHLAWEYREGEVHTRRDQFLDPAPAGCSYRTSDSFYGAPAGAMMDAYGAAIELSFNAVAAALKLHAETKWRDATSRKTVVAPGPGPGG